MSHRYRVFYTFPVWVAASPDLEWVASFGTLAEACDAALDHAETCREVCS